MPEPTIETRELTRRFDGLTAVDRLSISVARGEVVGLLGPNGAGKTTTIRMLAALIPPTSGEAMICGHRLGTENDRIRQSIGLLTEAPGLYDRLSAFRNIEFHARLQGVSDIEFRVERYLELLGLWDRRHEAVGTFSKGMRQKLALARALLHEPDVLLLDEPTAGLDPRMARVVREFIASLKAEGRTILLSTHNLEEAERLCDRIALLQSRLVAFDPPAELRQRIVDYRVRMRLDAPGRDLVAVVQALPSVRAAALEDGILTVTLADDAATPELVRRLVREGAGIHEIVPLRPTLEEVYLSLIDDADAVERVP